jgi:predicted ester cyclase
MSVEENKEAVRQFYALFKRKEFDAASRLIAPGFISHRTTGDMSGDQLLSETNAILKAFPDTSISIEHLIGEGDLVSFREVATGTHTGEYMGIPPTGRKFKIVNACTLRIHNGKWVEAWTNIDQFNQLQQLGAVLDRNEATKQIKGFAEKVVKAETECILQGNYSSLESLFSSQVIMHHTPFPDMAGWPAIKRMYERLRESTPDIHIELKYVTGEGNLLVLSYKSRGKFTGNVEGYPPPTEKEVTDDAMQIFRIENGKTIEVWIHATVKGLT